jgi:hypothetical protein
MLWFKTVEREIRMSKPFDIELAKKARKKEVGLVEKLKQLFKTLRVELGPGKNHNIELFLENRKIAAIEVEVVRQDRWNKIKTKYPTVRWSAAKKRYATEEMPVFMASTPDDLSDIFVIDARTWVREGREEKERFVRAGGKTYVYRKGGEEPFWAIDKNKVHWGYDGLEEYILKTLGLA